MTVTGLAIRLRFRVSLWIRARLLPLLVGRRPFQHVLGLAVYRGPPIFRGLNAAYICQRVQGTAKLPVLMRRRRCLREGLLGHYFLQAAGFQPQLRFGVDRASLSRRKVKAHCWVCLDARPVLNDRTEGLVEVFAFPPDRPTWSGAQGDLQQL